MKKLVLLFLISISIISCKKKEEEKKEESKLTPPSWIIGKWSNSDGDIYEFKENDFCRTINITNSTLCLIDLYKDNENTKIEDESTDSFYKIYKLPYNTDRTLIYEFLKISTDTIEKVTSSGNVLFIKITN